MKFKIQLKQVKTAAKLFAALLQLQNKASVERRVRKEGVRIQETEFISRKLLNSGQWIGYQLTGQPVS